MAATVFYMYPNGETDFGPGGWTIDPLASLVDEPQDAPLNLGDYGESMPVATPVTWLVCWSMTPPAAAVVITTVSLYVRLWAVTENSTPHDLTDVKGVTQIGGTNYYTAGQTIYGTTAAEGPHPALYLLGDMAVNPATAVAWTIPELQAGAFGVQYGDLDVGSNTPRTRIGQFYVRVEAETIAQSIEGRRAEGTHYLLTVGRQHGIFEVSAPPTFVDVEPGDVVAVSDSLGPTAAGTGWGQKAWERREALVLENEWQPLMRRCRLVLFDLRFFQASLWWQPKTDLPYTPEGQGIPYIDAGGHWTITRASAAYVRKQTDDILYAEVPIDFAKWASTGLQVGGGGDVTRTLNDSFSQGTGDVFTSWTSVVSGTGAIVQDLVDFVFDAAGLRRSAVLGTGATAGGQAYVQQSHAVTGPAWGRVAILYKHDGGGLPSWQLTRGVDGFDWNDTTEAWEAGPVVNDAPVVTSGETLRGLYSRLISFATGVDTYVLNVGYPPGAATVTNDQVHLYFAALISGAQADVDGFRSLDVTTVAAVTRARDDIRLANAAAVRWWNPYHGGQLEIRLRTLFQHAAMADGTVKPILFCEGADVDDFELIYYTRVSAGEGRWAFWRSVGGVDYIAYVPITSGFPDLFEAWQIAARWTGPDAELDLPEGTLSILANGVWSAPVTAELPDTGPESTVYLGWVPAPASVAGDFVLEALRARKLCLTDDETLRELG